MNQVQMGQLCLSKENHLHEKNYTKKHCGACSFCQVLFAVTSERHVELACDYMRDLLIYASDPFEDLQ